MKYQFLLHTWGGFYNREFRLIHNQKEGYHYFDTKEQRDDYLQKLRKIEKELTANYLMTVESEGYNTKEVTTLHRVIRYEGKEYYSSYELRPCNSYSHAKYFLENKWYPGCNDYPLGDDFDYSNVETIQEWITGAFDIKDE